MSFGSLDSVDDACDVLDKSEFPYVLMIMQGPNSTRFVSNLGKQGMVESGELLHELHHHLEHFYKV